MVNYQKILKTIETQKKELKREKTFIPSQLSASKKKTIKYDIAEKLSNLSEEQKELEQKHKSSEQFKKNLSKKIESLAKQKIISRGIVKSNKSTIVIKNNQPAPYVPVYFTAEINQTKKNLFFD